MRDVISCGAVVYRLNPSPEILLVQQSKNDICWGIPKGHMEDGETFVETARREVREETGIKIQIVGRLPSVLLKKKKFKKTVVPFLAIQTCNSKPQSDNKNSEVFAARWFNIFDLPPIYLYQKPVIDAAMIVLNNMHE